MDNNLSNITKSIRDILALGGFFIIAAVALSLIAEKILEKILGEKIVGWILKRVQWTIILITIVVSAILYFFIPRPDFEPLLIVLVSVFSVLCVVLLLLRLFLTPFGFENIRDLTNFAQGLKILESDNVQNSLKELKDIPDVVEGLKMARADVKIVDYKTQQKEISNLWVLGTVFNGDEQWKGCIEKLNKEIHCTYLCNGNKNQIESNVKSFKAWLEKERKPILLKEKLNYLVMHYTEGSIHLPKIFHEPEHATSSEVFIFFPERLDTHLKNYAILVKDYTLIGILKQEFLNLKRDENIIDLKLLID